MMKDNQKLDEEQLTLGGRGVRGGAITQHRALFSSKATPRKWLAAILLPALFDAGLYYGFESLSRAWLHFFRFWLDKLQIPGKVAITHSKLGFFVIDTPSFDMPSVTPDGYIWWLTAAVTALILLISYQLPKRWMPLNYFLRFAGLIQISALAFFAIIPAEFSYTIATFLDNLINSAIWLMFVVPWIHAMIYYIFDFTLAKKIGLTLITLAFIALALPFQVMTQAVLLVTCSLLILPVLYIFLGLFLLILVCIAIYGWAMSWERCSAD